MYKTVLAVLFILDVIFIIAVLKDGPIWKPQFEVLKRTVSDSTVRDCPYCDARHQCRVRSARTPEMERIEWGDLA